MYFQGNLKIEAVKSFVSQAILAAIVIAAAFSGPAYADRLKFAGFEQTESTLPDSYKQLRNNFEGLKAKRVHSFSIHGGDCVSGAYADGYGKGDCDYGSVHSWLRETGRGGKWIFPQPSEAWYGWDMLIPEAFPMYGQQTSGSYTFVGWKGINCPHASINHSTRKGEGRTIYLRLQAPRGNPSNHDCSDVARIPLMSARDFKGQWRNFQVYAKWTHKSDGKIIVYIDGEQRATYSGPTLNVPPDYPHKKAKANHFDFGVYLCCTAGVKHIQPGTVYFANVKRAGSQKKLGR